MAKGNGKQIKSEGANSKPLPVYIKSLTIEDVKCFKGKQLIDLSDSKGEPAQWTVILGNNNTGKTTILKCLAGLEPTEGGNIMDLTIAAIRSYNFPGFFTSGSNAMREFGNSILHKGGLFHTSMYFDDDLEKGTKREFEWGFVKQTFEDVDGAKVDGTAMQHWNESLGGFYIYSYGASRKMSKKPFSDKTSERVHANLFEQEDLPNVEDWLLNLFLAEKLGQSEAKNILELATKVLSSGLLPDIKEINLKSSEEGTGFVNFVEFRTDFGWIRLHDLGYGYQSMIAWVLDLVRNMVERYPGSSNPLSEPAIVLIDEIDLHLHPDWQRKIIAHLTKYFPRTQFIATAHSPLIVQSAEEVNIVILKKEGDSVHIEQPKIRSFRGWTVEEILTDLMDLEGQTMSKTYLDLMEQFDNALDSDDFEKAEDAYQKLDKILHPDSHQRKLLQLQMTSLSPANAL